NRLFRRLMDAIGRPELGADPRFRGAAGRNARNVEINEIVGEWVARRTVAEVVEALGPERANVPCSPVYTVDQLLEHPQLRARDARVRLRPGRRGEALRHARRRAPARTGPRRAQRGDLRDTPRARP